MSEVKKKKTSKDVVEVVTLLEEARLRESLEDVKKRLADTDKERDSVRKQLAKETDSEFLLAQQRVKENSKLLSKMFCGDDSKEVLLTNNSVSYEGGMGIFHIVDTTIRNRGSENNSPLQTITIPLSKEYMTSEAIRSLQLKEKNLGISMRELSEFESDIHAKLNKLDAFSRKVKLSLKVEELKKTKEGRETLASAKEILAKKDSLISEKLLES